MRLENIKVYSYNELDNSTQCKIRDRFALNMEYPWFNEAIESIEHFCHTFGVKINDYRIDPDDYRGSYIRHNADNSNFRGYTLANAKKLLDSNGNGYCVYFDCINAFYDQFKLNGDAKGAFQYALEYAIKSIESDIEYQYSKEAIEDLIAANEYEFLENGDIFH